MPILFRTRGQHQLLVIIAPILLILLIGSSQADGPADNQVQSVRPMPPPGIKIDDEVRKELKASSDGLHSAVVELRKNKSLLVTKFLPDVEIIDRAIQIALNEDGFFEPRDVDSARNLIAVGNQRAERLKAGFPAIESPNTNEVGFTVRGYRSKLDGSVQPYGVAWNKSGKRAEVWCRGRSEKGLELQFIAKHLNSPDPLPYPGVLTIYPLGRYCNANKLAGEVDTLEALEHATREYNIDPKQVAIRGFSMGGAAAWHLAVHYPDKWFAAAPGAGFSETPQFLKVFQSESLTPAPYEQTLWQLYDCDKWALNLKNVPTIAYSGAIDKQKQAADVMAQACLSLPEPDAFELTHIIAPDTAHKITPEARAEIERRLNVIHSVGAYKKTPSKVWFTTYTLKYNRCHWITVERLQEHWTAATVKAKLTIQENRAVVDIESISGISEFKVSLDADQLPESVTHLVIRFAGDRNESNSVISEPRRSDWSFQFSGRLNAKAKTWQRINSLEQETGLRKQHNLQGPIDDAFMNSFVFVPPSGVGNNAASDAWVKSEMDRAVRQWHLQMRGDVRVIAADQLKDVDVKENNLILWGDPKSNPKIAELLEKLPIKWTTEELSIGKTKVTSSNHVPLLIYPNPQAPSRYIVINSSFTFREYDYLNNARQVPKLPDWAIIDVTTPPDARWPGKVVAADFFDENWQFKQR